MTPDNSSIEFRRQLRGLFAVLRAIIRRSATGEGSRDEYAAHLEGRIGALARVHDMLMRAPADAIDLEALVQGELLAQAVPAVRYRTIGPDTCIGRDAAMPLALALHELALNSLLHGVIGEPVGDIEVRWDHQGADGGRRLRITWEERGVPKSRHPPTSKGFGLELIEKTLPYELDAWTRVDWPEPGAKVEIHLPAEGKTTFWRPGDKTDTP